MKFNAFSVPPIILLYLNKKMKLERLDESGDE
jgi:hypothetical protein